MKKTARRSYPVFELYLNTSYSAPPKSTSGQFAAPRRLTYYLVKAPYSGTEIGVFMFLSGRKFPRNRRFLDHSSKTGSDGAERFRVKSYVPLALSNGTWMRAVGLPVWAGHRQPCFFCFSVCPSGKLSLATGHSF